MAPPTIQPKWQMLLVLQLYGIEKIKDMVLQSEDCLRSAAEKDADVMVTLDSDGQHNPDEIPQIVGPILNERFDIVIGSRFLRDNKKQEQNKIPTYRNLGIRTITRLTQSASYSQVTDAQSGFRAYSKNALSKISLFEDGMAASTEILLRASEKNLIIKEVPISIKYDIEKPSTHNPISHGVGVTI